MADDNFGLSFCKEYNVDFCHDKSIDFCPCRFIINSIEFCNFTQFIVELNKEKGSMKYNKFLKLICKDNSHLIQKFDINAKDTRIRMAKTVKDIEDGNFRLGNIVYCIKDGEDVTILELPPKEHFDIYQKFGVFPGDIKYQTSNGKIRHAAVACFNTISKGSFFTEYVMEGKDNNIRVKKIKQLAKRNGFRVELRKIKEGYKLCIFGDSQHDVDSFIELCSLISIF